VYCLHLRVPLSPRKWRLSTERGTRGHSHAWPNTPFIICHKECVSLFFAPSSIQLHKDLPGRNGIVPEHVNNSFVTVEWPCFQLSAMCANVMPCVPCVNRRPCGEWQKKDSCIHSAGAGTETAN